MTENKEQKREDMIGGDEIAVVPANEEIGRASCRERV